MKKLSILGLVLVFVMAFSFGAMADVENTGDDPLGEEGDGWIINEGSLEGWEDSNFESLSNYDSGESTEVGTGITVEGACAGDECPGKEPGEVDTDQEINYTVSAYAEIPGYLEMNFFGNGAYMNATNLGEVNGDGYENNDHLMLFDTEYGGVVDGSWEFVDSGDLNPEDVIAEDSEIYIQGCDIFTANLFANVPYGFSVSSEGLGNGELPIEMRALNGDLDNNGEGDWSATETLVDDGIEVGDYEALEEAQVNMQFRVPFNQVAAGVYEGDITFSMYSM
ncbi:MAG: hypothetical protein ACOC1M_03780 [Halanaerobium sp.]